MGANTVKRFRRLRTHEGIRALVRENHLSCADLIYPIFVHAGEVAQSPIASMPGIFQYSLDALEEVLAQVESLDIPAVLLFGLPEHKDEQGSGAWAEDGVVQQALRRARACAPGLYLISDVCLCGYTSHGHCGVVDKAGQILNDESVALLTQVAVSHAQSGAHMVAPSDMMDGRVAEMRFALDEAGYAEVPIMSYAAKYASALYGPFREAASSAPQFGDRSSYQMDPANGDEALREVLCDVEEGADVILVKPALAYGDIIYRVKQATALPVAAYNVSGEYAMVKAAVERGFIDERKVVLELLLGMKRAGADMLITYHALDVARWLGE